MFPRFLNFSSSFSGLEKHQVRRDHLHLPLRSRDDLRRADRNPRAQVRAVHASVHLLAKSSQLLQKAGYADSPQQRPLSQEKN